MKPALPTLFAALALFTGCMTQPDPAPHSAATTAQATARLAAEPDPYLWLEEVQGKSALDWVRAQNSITKSALEARPGFGEMRTRLLDILDSREKIPFVTKRGPHLYNFWRDQQHVRGLWRRTTLDEYRKAEPAWETILDLDRLAAEEKENWVWAGADFLEPTFDRALISLSRGGADATVVREFDLSTKAFVRDGFQLPEAKSFPAWRDRDSLYVATDFGAGSLTKSGYPRVVKLWQRGTPLSNATLVREGQESDVGLFPFVTHDRGHKYEGLVRSPTMFTSEYHFRRDDAWVRIDKPEDADVSTFGDQILITLRKAWTVGGKTFPAGALLAADFNAFVAGKRDLAQLFEPGPRKSLAGVSGTRHFLLVNELENVRNQLFVLQLKDGRWSREPLPVPGLGTILAQGVDPEASDDYFLTFTSYLTPTTLSLGTVGKPDREPLKQLPAFFKPDGLHVQQFEAVSRDGTRIPYFQISRTNLTLDSRQPTLLYGYGGFEVPEVPLYSGLAGVGWLEQGGVYVVANIRGGGEFGPPWHQAALRENRQRAYDDFIAVAEDLIRRKVTSPRHLGIEGGSNGGLLVGAVMVQRPDLFNAVVCQVPLLDMRRYHLLLAGASWMEEYGDPDKPDQWAYLQKYSPYHNVLPTRQYPRVLFVTSTRDDRVHPGHARKMAARMKEQGHSLLYYENTEGGHAGAADNPQRAYMEALSYAFLWNQLR